MKIAIIGAGIAGLLPAYYLAKQGVQVEVFETESHAAMKCSHANGGQLSVSNSEVWIIWHNVVIGIIWMFKDDAPLLIRPSLDLDKLRWIIKFLQSVRAGDQHQRTVRTIKLGLESRILYQQIIEQEGIEFDHSTCGILHFYKNNKDFDRAKQLHDMYVDNGCEWTILDANGVKEKEPSLGHLDDLVGGIWTPSDGVGDIHKFCTGLAKVLEDKYSVKFRYDKTVENITDLIGYDYVVVAAGINSMKFARQVGVNLNLYPVKGYSITIASDNLPTVSLLDDEAKIVTSTLGSRLRVAGTAELNGENYDILYSRILPLLRWTESNLPTVSTEEYSLWACLRPMSPDMMPTVGKFNNHSNVIFHTGHGHLGWTLSPATAQQVVELVFNR